MRLSEPFLVLNHEFQRFKTLDYSKFVTAHSRKFLFKAIEIASKEEYPLFLIVLT